MNRCNSHLSLLPVKPGLFFFFFLAVGTLLCFYAMSCGAGLTTDSHHYLAAARSLLQNGTLHNADGTVYTNWPPLYPVVLAMVRANVQLIAWMQNAFYTGMLLLVYWFSLEFRNATVRLLFLLSMVFGLPVLLVFTFVWSDGIFIFLTLVVYACLRVYQRNRQILYYIALIFFSNLMCLQRLAGIFFVFIIGFLILRLPNHRQKCLLYVLLSVSLLLLWLYRNTFFEADPSYNANLLATPIIQSISNYLDALGNWFVPHYFPYLIKVIIVCLWLLSLAWFYWHYRFLPDSLAFQTTFLAVGYLVALPFTNGNLSDIDRYIAPAYVWATMSTFVQLDTWLPTLSVSRRRLVVILIALWLVYPVARTVRNVTFWHRVRCTSVANYQ